jgi:hypothetical protein
LKTIPRLSDVISAAGGAPSAAGNFPGNDAVWGNISLGFGRFLGRFCGHFQKQTSQVFLFSKIRRREVKNGKTGPGPVLE